MDVLQIYLLREKKLEGIDEEKVEWGMRWRSTIFSVIYSEEKGGEYKKSDVFVFTQF